MLRSAASSAPLVCQQKPFTPLDDPSAALGGDVSKLVPLEAGPGEPAR